MLALTFSYTPPLSAQAPSSLTKDSVASKNATTPSAQAPIPQHELENGVRFLLLPNPIASKVTVNMVVFVGSRHEGYGEAGMAHLLEHMLFKGTPKHPNIPKLLSDHGVPIGSGSNANTTVDRTLYYESLAPTDDNLEFAIKLEADRLVNSYVKREDLLSEMTVVRNEFEIKENNPLTILSERMMAAAYNWHNYGKTVLGNRSDIERVPIDRLQAFYRKYYQPDNVLVIVAGKFDEKKAFGLVTKYFGELKRPARKLDETYTEEPVQDGERNVVLRRVGSVGAVSVLYHIPAGRHDDSVALDVLKDVLTSVPTGRLYTALVSSKKATSVGGSAFSAYDPGVLELYALVDPKGSLEQVRDQLVSVVERLASAPVTEEEVQRSKRKFANLFELAVENSEELSVALAEYAAQGDWRLFFLDRERYARVTKADVMRVAARYLQPTNRTVGIYIPTQEPQRTAIPAAVPAASMVKDLKFSLHPAKAAQNQLNPQQNASNGKNVAGEVFDPTPENIEKRIQRSILPGGIKVVFLPKKTEGDTISAQLVLRFGNERSLKGCEMAAQFLGGFMLRGGTQHHTYQQLVDEVNKLNAGISLNSGAGWLSCTFSVKKENFLPTLRLVAEVLREPAFTQSEFDLMKRQTKHNLELGRTDPPSSARRILNEKLNPFPQTDIRYVPTLEETISRVDALTAEQVRKLYAEQLGAQVGEFVAVGPVDSKSTVEILQKALADWKASVRYERIVSFVPRDVRGTRQNLIMSDKSDAFYNAAHLVAMSDTHPDYFAIQVANLVLGGDSFTSRLGSRVRQKEGLSYTVGTYLNVDDEDDYTVFGIEANCNPINIDKLNTAIDEELKKLVKEGISEKELAEAKKLYLHRRTLSLSNDGQLLYLLRAGVRLGRPFADFKARNDKIAQLTVAGVNEAIRKHISPERLIVIRAGDFKKVADKRNGT
jgi:zinc protease